MSTRKTIGDTGFGSSMKDLADGDFERGYFNAEPEGNFERSPSPLPVLSDEGHDEGNPGFVHRPRWKGDVGRN